MNVEIPKNYDKSGIEWEESDPIAKCSTDEG